MHYRAGLPALPNFLPHYLWIKPRTTGNRPTRPTALMLKHSTLRKNAATPRRWITSRFASYTIDRKAPVIVATPASTRRHQRPHTNHREWQCENTPNGTCGVRIWYVNVNWTIVTCQNQDCGVACTQHTERLIRQHSAVNKLTHLCIASHSWDTYIDGKL